MSGIFYVAQCVKKEALVIIIVKNVLATVPPGHDMVVCPGGLDANAASHALSSAHLAILSRCCTLTPFP